MHNSVYHKSHGAFPHGTLVCYTSFGNVPFPLPASSLLLRVQPPEADFRMARRDQEGEETAKACSINKRLLRGSNPFGANAYIRVITKWALPIVYMKTSAHTFFAVMFVFM